MGNILTPFFNRGLAESLRYKTNLIEEEETGGLVGREESGHEDVERGDVRRLNSIVTTNQTETVSCWNKILIKIDWEQLMFCALAVFLFACFAGLFMTTIAQIQGEGTAKELVFTKTINTVVKFENLQRRRLVYNIMKSWRPINSNVSPAEIGVINHNVDGQNETYGHEDDPFHMPISEKVVCRSFNGATMTVCMIPCMSTSSTEVANRLHLWLVMNEINHFISQMASDSYRVYDEDEPRMIWLKMKTGDIRGLDTVDLQFRIRLELRTKGWDRVVATVN